ncbi:hypothetical protein THAOC_13361 [Thalassiosira oceanica]|uniref:Uncharacterized protein n=1 Tax=Thalassiosira oceanica TaxID=159749 RepID=K0SHY4_THAOC|nr:hypothetical protein THAOC_13361 [Thalassiosira oceanica]|eukprot:EJK65753.1 hypothetical protein THAOC_13361 [Thalassiosira oceanica]
MKHDSFFKQSGGQGSEQGRKEDADDAQTRKVVAVTRCQKGAVLSLSGLGTTSEANDRVRAATTHAILSADKGAQPTSEPRREAGGEGLKEDIRVRDNLDAHDSQLLLVHQGFMSLLTSDAEQAMRNRGTQWEAMEKATGMDRIFAFIKLYKEVANPTDTSSGVSSLQAMKLLKLAVSTSTSQEKLKLKSGAQLGEEVKQRMEAASNAGAYVVIAQKEEAYMAKKKLTWDNPTSQEQAAGYARMTNDQRIAMREKLQSEVGGLIFMTSLSPFGKSGHFCDAVNNNAIMSGKDPLAERTITDLVGMLSRHTGDKPRPSDKGDGGAEKEATNKRLALTTTGEEKDTKGGTGKTFCVDNEDVCRLVPDNERRLWFDAKGKPFRCTNKACKDAKKDLGHGIKLCPNKENKEEDATTDGGLALTTVGLSNQAIKQVLFGGAAVGGGTTTGIGLTTAGARGNPSPDSGVARNFGGGKAGVGHTGRKAGVGPVSAVSATTVAPPAGPQECVGKEYETGLGQASKPLKSPFAPVGVQSSQRSQTKGNDRINSQRSHNLIEV